MMTLWYRLPFPPVLVSSRPRVPLSPAPVSLQIESHTLRFRAKPRLGQTTELNSCLQPRTLSSSTCPRRSTSASDSLGSVASLSPPAPSQQGLCPPPRGPQLGSLNPALALVARAGPGRAAPAPRARPAGPGDSGALSWRGRALPALGFGSGWG